MDITHALAKLPIKKSEAKAVRQGKLSLAISGDRLIRTLTGDLSAQYPDKTFTLALGRYKNLKPIAAKGHPKIANAEQLMLLDTHNNISDAFQHLCKLKGPVLHLPRGTLQ